MTAFLATLLVALLLVAAPAHAQDDDATTDGAAPAAQPGDGDDQPADSGESDGNADDESADDDDESDDAEDHPGVAGLKHVLESVHTEGMTMRSFAMSLADEYKFNVVMAKGVPGDTIRLSLRHVPVGLALAAAARSVDCDIAIAKGIAFVWPSRPDEPDRTHHIFEIPCNAGEADAFRQQIQDLVSGSAVVLVEPNSRVLFVVATTDELDTVARYIVAIKTRGESSR